jgi:hypothetical protein
VSKPGKRSSAREQKCVKETGHPGKCSLKSRLAADSRMEATAALRARTSRGAEGPAVEPGDPWAQAVGSFGHGDTAAGAPRVRLVTPLSSATDHEARRKAMVARPIFQLTTTDPARGCAAGRSRNEASPAPVGQMGNYASCSGKLSRVLGTTQGRGQPARD